jgi:hypothetical protein
MNIKGLLARVTAYQKYGNTKQKFYELMAVPAFLYGIEIWIKENRNLVKLKRRR